MVCSVDQYDLDRRVPKRFGRGQAAEATAYDNYARLLRSLAIRAIDRIEISVVKVPTLRESR